MHEELAWSVCYLFYDAEDGRAVEVHEAGAAAAPGPVVVDAVDDAAAGVVDGAAVAVEHQRLHPHGEHLPLLARAWRRPGRRRRRQ